MPEKTKNQAVQNITLKDRVDDLSQENLLSKNTENPVEKLRFQELREKIKNKKRLKVVISSYNVWISALVIFLIGASIVLNSSLFKKADYKLFNFAAMSANKISSCFSGINNFILAQFSSPYVVTIGEYGNVLVAKNEAIEILPQFKQINIKKLDSGIYTFEMERFSSKDKAYALANEFIQSGLDVVHVRYLPKK